MQDLAPAVEPGVKSARRVLDILELLARHHDGATFSQIASELALPRSSLHGLLATLGDRRWISYDEGTRTYRVGVRSWEVGQAFDSITNLQLIAKPHVQAAKDELEETVQLGVLDGLEVVYIAKVQSDHPLQLVSSVGMRLPAYATGIGKVLLAALPVDELHRRLAGVELMQYTSNTATSVPDLQTRLDAVRSKGYGTDDAEYTAGVFCVAVPVRDGLGTVVAALSCSVPDARLRREDDRGRLARVLNRYARAISQGLDSDYASTRTVNLDTR